MNTLVLMKNTIWEFTRVPTVSNHKNYLCGLTVGNQGVTCSETCYFHQLSDHEKDVYTMLARVLDTVCVLENTNLADPHKDMTKRVFDEKEIVPKFHGFYCFRM